MNPQLEDGVEGWHSVALVPDRWRRTMQKRSLQASLDRPLEEDSGEAHLSVEEMEPRCPEGSGHYRLATPNVLEKHIHRLNNS